MPSSTTPVMATKERLDGIRATISGRRDELAAARRTRDEIRAKVTTNRGALSEAELEEANKAVAAIRAGEEQLAAACREEDTILALLGEGGGALGRGNGPSDEDPAVTQLAETPGRWLRSVLLNAAPSVPGAADRLSAMAGPMALEGALDLDEAGTVEIARAVVELIRPRSALAAAGVPVLGIESTEAKVPWVKGRPEAKWRKEGEAFAKGTPTVEMFPVDPGSCGVVSPLSIEVFDDVRPIALAAVQRQIITAVAVETDRGLIQGEGEETPEPLGILNTPGIGSIEGTLSNLDSLIEGVGALLATEHDPTACLIHPADALALGLLREFSGDTTSLKPLIGLGGRSFTTPHLPGTTFYPTKAAAEGRPMLLDPTSIAVVLRKSADLSIDPFYDFDNGLIAMRCYVRADVLVEPEGVVEIDTAGS